MPLDLGERRRFIRAYQHLAAQAATIATEMALNDGTSSHIVSLADSLRDNAELRFNELAAEAAD